MFQSSWRRWTIIACLFSLPLYSLGLVWAQRGPLTSEQRMKRDITYLASDECEGRGPGTKGIDRAADYIVEQFKQAGLKPGGVKGSWFQPFTFGKDARLGKGKNTLTLHGPDEKTIELKLNSGFQVLGNSGSGKASAPLVFVGYGTQAKEIDFDEYKGVDVAGKIVVVLRRLPRWKNSAKPFAGKKKEFYAGLENKLALAEKHKAVAIILINDASEKNDELIPFNTFAAAGQRTLPAVNVTRAEINGVFRSGMKKSLRKIENAIDKDLKPMSGPFTGWTATVSTNVDRNEPYHVKNVIGVLEGAGPLAKETVVVGAHYDHLGFGGTGSRAPGVTAVHHGADDNASGTTSVMELARRFGAIRNRRGRRIVFMTFSGEERGLLGSRYYCNKEPLFPLKDTVAMVNLDMVGRLSGDEDGKGGKLIVEGVGTAKGFERLVDELNTTAGFKFQKTKGSSPYSDHDSFYRQKVPILFFWNGTHEQYHKPSDTSELINVPGMKRIADLAEHVILDLASAPRRPEYVSVPNSTITTIPKGPRLGFAPDYDDSVKGLKVGGITVDGVAAKAGIETGDIIVEISGQQVKNIQTYMTIMASHRIGETIDVTVMRGGKKLTLKANLK